MKKELKTIYQYFNEYSVEDVNKMLALLSKKEKNLLKLKFGDDLFNSNYNSQLKKNQNAYYNSFILPKMKKLLKGEYIQRNEYWRSDISIYDYFDKYTREEIDAVLSRLKKADRYLLELRCGNDLDNPVVSDKITKTDKHRFSNFLIPKLRNMLENRENNVRETMTKNRVLTIYEYFSNYSKEEIDRVLEILTDEEKELLNVRFFVENEMDSYNVLTGGKYQKWYLLIKKIKRLLNNSDLYVNINNGRICKKLYYYFPNYSKEEVDAVIENLPQEDKDVLNLRYRVSEQEELGVWTKKDAIHFFKGVIPKIRRKLEKTKCTVPVEHKLKDIYMRYPGYSKEDIDKCVESLSLNEKQLLSLKYTNIGILPVSDIEMTDIVKKRIRYIVDTKLNKRLKLINEPTKTDINSRRRLVSIYEHFKGYNKELINEVVNSLSCEEKKLLKLKYGDNLEEPIQNVTMSSDEKIKFNYLLQVTITKKLHYLSKTRSYVNDFENHAINKAELNQVRILMDLIYSSEYRSLLEKYSMKDTMILFLYFVGLNNVKFSIKMITDFLSIDISDVKSIIESYLLSIKESIINPEKTNENCQLVYKKENL